MAKGKEPKDEIQRKTKPPGIGAFIMLLVVVVAMVASWYAGMAFQSMFDMRAQDLLSPNSQHQPVQVAPAPPPTNFNG